MSPEETQEERWALRKGSSECESRKRVLVTQLGLTVCDPTDLGFPGGSVGKESIWNFGDLGSIPELGRSPGGGLGNPLQYSYLENPHGQWSLVGYSPWGRTELDMTEQLSRAQTVARQATLPMVSSRQEHWSGLPFPSPGDLPNISPR